MADTARPDFNSMELIGVTSASNGMENIHPELKADADNYLNEEGIIPRPHRSSYNLLLEGRGYQGIKLNIKDHSNNVIGTYFVVVYDDKPKEIYIYKPKGEASGDGT